MKKLFAVFCAVLMLFGNTAFADYDADGIAYDLSKVVGDKMNVGEFASYCVDYFKLYDVIPAENSFTDLSKENANYDNVLRLVKMGYILGNGNGTVGTDDIISNNRAYIIVSRIMAKNSDTGAYETPNLPPNVTSEMCSPSFWLAKQKEPEKVILTEKQIAETNKKIETEMDVVKDLSALNETFNGVTLANALADFKVDGTYYDGDSKVGEDYYGAIRKNITGAKVKEQMPLKYGFAVNRTVMRIYPYEGMLTDTPEDPEWDEFCDAEIHLNEPLAVYFTTADGKFTYAESYFCKGWVRTEDIALCKNKTEWSKLLSPKDFLVVTGDKIFLEKSIDEDLSQKEMSMGTRLALSEQSGMVQYRLPWHNYVVKMPCRGEDGSLYFKDALIPANRDVNVGNLKYTTENLVKQTFKHLGNRYGWGGSLDATDCSTMAREIYRCFGFNIPCNSTGQAAMPVKVTDASEMTAEEKAVALENTRPGAILQMPGHIMIYTGKENGLFYTVNNVRLLVNPLAPEDGMIMPGGVVLNDMSTLRANNTTWFDNLLKIVEVE